MTAPYLDLLRHVLSDGEVREDRTGTGTISVFGAQIRFDLRDGFPLLTTKKVAFSAVVHELLWFLRGSTNINDGLTQHTKIWDDWADERGELGPIYGYQWRSWGAGSTECGAGIDQISEVVEQLKRNPNSRRLIVSAWNVADVPKMKLPPCHLMFQFYVARATGAGGLRYLDCQLYQRSADLALGVPFNIASYALLMSMIAQECGMIPRYFIHTFGDAHVYLNHVDGVKRQLERAPLPLPRLVLVPKPLLEMAYEDVAVDGYVCHPAIKFSVSV
jgi:thymidylate synthase